MHSSKNRHILALFLRFSFLTFVKFSALQICFIFITETRMLGGWSVTIKSLKGSSSFKISSEKEESVEI